MSVAATPPPMTPAPLTPPSVVFGGEGSIGPSRGFDARDVEPGWFPLSKMSVGMWTAGPRWHSELRFLPCKDRFVFAVIRSRRRVVSTLGRALELVSKFTGLPVPTSPFNLEGGVGGSAGGDDVAMPGEANARGDAATTSSSTPLRFTPGGGWGSGRDAAIRGDTPGANRGTPTNVNGANVAMDGGATPAGARASLTYEVLTYEVAYADVAGLDYRNPLCDDGRLAIEARAMTVRAFASFDDATRFFDDASNKSERPVKPARHPRKGGERRRSVFRDGGGGGSKHKAATDHSSSPAAAEDERRGGDGVGTARKRSRMATTTTTTSTASSMESSRLASRFEAVAASRGSPGGFAPFRVWGVDGGVVRGAGSKTPNESKISGVSGVSGVSANAANAGNAAVSSPAPPLSVRTPGGDSGADGGTPAFGVHKHGSAYLPASSEGARGGSFTYAVPAVYTHETLVVHFSHPSLPDALRRRVQSPGTGLLRLYETGLPPWALLLPRCGFYYRPWLRTLARGLFVLVSVLSMMAGFYDLYKHVPGLDAVFTRFWKPLGDFLERHAAARLSILASYLFTQSRMFGPVLAQLSSAARLARSWTAAVWAPIIGVFGPYSRQLWASVPLGPVAAQLASIASITASSAKGAASSVGLGVGLGSIDAWRAAIGPWFGRSSAIGSSGAASSVALGGFGVGWIASAMGNGASLRRNWLDWWRTIGVTVLRATQRILAFFVYLIGRVTSHRMSLGMAARRRFGGVAASAARAHGFESGGASPSASRDDTLNDDLVTDVTEVTESRVDGDGDGAEDEVTSGRTNAATTVEGHEKTE